MILIFAYLVVLACLPMLAIYLLCFILFPFALAAGHTLITINNIIEHNWMTKITFVILYIVLLIGIIAYF